MCDNSIGGSLFGGEAFQAIKLKNQKVSRLLPWHEITSEEGALAVCNFASRLPTPCGVMTLAADGECLTGAWFEGQKFFGELAATAFARGYGLEVLKKAACWLSAYFASEKPGIDDLPLAPEGSGFRLRVWELLLKIPYGQCVTYGELARKLAPAGKTMSSQAVGGAVGHNPISVIIPCHRVIGCNGNLTGYAGGLGLKLKLLKHEGVDTSRLRMPTRRHPH